jgi:uncharacterized membrane protein YecN with MAPEG domain
MRGFSMLLPITLTFAAACALLNLWIATRCARIRITDKVMHGDAGNSLLARRMRAHANFVEYTPIVLILFALVELAIGASLWLWIGALVYVVARVAHAFGMDADKPTLGRDGGDERDGIDDRLWGDADNASAPFHGFARVRSARPKGLSGQYRIGDKGVGAPLIGKIAHLAVAGDERRFAAQRP